MAPLSNGKHELFAQALAKGETARQAYQAAGYRPSDAHASRLASNGKVRARVAELQAEAAAEVVVSTASLIGEFEEARAMAKRLERPNAMVAASTAKGKMLGLFAKPGAGRFADDPDPELEDLYGTPPPHGFIDAPRFETYEQWHDRFDRRNRLVAEIEAGHLQQQAAEEERERAEADEAWRRREAEAALRDAEIRHQRELLGPDAAAAFERARLAGVNPVKLIDRFLERKAEKAAVTGPTNADAPRSPDVKTLLPKLATYTPEPEPVAPTTMPVARPRRVLS